eukprot:SAG31_NODE_3109_length_4665_cov_2.150022_1_plen_245_part_10
MNSTCGVDGKPCHSVDPNTPYAGSPLRPTAMPDVAMSGVGRYKRRFESQERFYGQAATGSLPGLSWLMPPTEASDHPCFDVAKGERFTKDVFEALRAGPKWNRTLLLVLYDDAGCYYDHVVPPFCPHDGAACNPNATAQCTGKNPSTGKAPCLAFDFRRLGLRVPAMLISPWVAKGAVFQQPRGPTSTSEFEHSSIPATMKQLFNLSTFLTRRDAWAGSIDELLLEAPRADDDCPMHLPDAPPAA